MHRSRHPLLHLLMALLIAAAPLQGVFAELAAASDGDFTAHSTGMPATAIQAHHHGAAATTEERRDQPPHLACECCPDDLSGRCGNCAVSHCASGHCAATAIIPVALAGIFADIAGVRPDLSSVLLPPSAISPPFRPPQA